MQHKKLKEMRILKGFTQKGMAEKNAMEQTTYSRKETGKSPIKDAEWIRFAKTLGVAIEDIKEEIASIKPIDILYIPQNIVDIIVKYNQKLEEENQLLKEKLKK